MSGFVYVLLFLYSVGVFLDVYFLVTHFVMVQGLLFCMYSIGVEVHWLFL